jgi:hypothetical protein
MQMMMQTTMMQHSAEVQQGHEQKMYHHLEVMVDRLVLGPVALAVAAMVVLPLVFDHPS